MFPPVMWLERARNDATSSNSSSYTTEKSSAGERSSSSSKRPTGPLAPVCSSRTIPFAPGTSSISLSNATYTSPVCEIRASAFGIAGGALAHGITRGLAVEACPKFVVRNAEFNSAMIPLAFADIVPYASRTTPPSTESENRRPFSWSRMFCTPWKPYCGISVRPVAVIFRLPLAVGTALVTVMGLLSQEPGEQSKSKPQSASVKAADNPFPLNSTALTSRESCNSNSSVLLSARTFSATALSENVSSDVSFANFRR
mmetsp:Transcript_15903/g.39328  ORF Transcript_15903/g.39328 Transcript_15903/m.39328 type:complete len:257 (+) Transcript_15903:14088-14858(+)